MISDETWAVICPLFPPAKRRGRPPVARRVVVEAVVWRFRTGAPWRDLPERFGNWNTVTYNGRNVVERCFALAIQWGPWLTATTARHHPPRRRGHVGPHHLR